MVLSMEKQVVVEKNGKKYTVSVSRLKFGQAMRVFKEAGASKINFTTSGEPVYEMDYLSLVYLITKEAIAKIEGEGNEIVSDKEKFLDELDYEEAKKIVSLALELNPLDKIMRIF